jgi:hypothetical protein
LKRGKDSFLKRMIYALMVIGLLAVAAPQITSAASYTTSANAAPATAPRGTSTTLTAVVKSSAAVKVLVDLEVYNASGQKVYQRAWDNQSFTAGQQRTFSAAWSVPAGATTGAYSLKIGIFSPGWATLYSWNNSAGQLTVSTSTAPTATPKPTATPATPPTATPKPTATPVTPPTATPVTPGTGRYFATLPPGSALPSDAECAAAIKRRPENKRMNATYNATRGNQRLASDFLSGDPRANTQIAARVTGNFSGSTDEILQWAACKWGVDEDMVRAQAAIESWWRQGTKGDWTTNAANCAPGHGLGVDGQAGQCPESFGILQNRYPYEKSAWPGIDNSTAFNADTAYAIWRSCYEGYEWWLNDVERGQQYAAGDAWGCMGRWFAGRWHTQAANDYTSRVQGYLSQRIWEQSSFQEP